jgi:hypothetical protein
MPDLRITSDMSADDLAKLRRSIKADRVTLTSDDGHRTDYPADRIIYFTGINGTISFTSKKGKKQ